jgi:hypothetical protein
MGLNGLKFPVVDNSVVHRPVHERNVTVSGPSIVPPKHYLLSSRRSSQLP